MLLKPNDKKKSGQSSGNRNRTVFICTLIGLLFIGGIFGLQNIIPTNTDWVRFGGGDNFQHYIGWRFFRESPWTKHFLFLQNLNYPQGTSVIVTDSNPLFSVVFKLFRSVLPAEFQFNGLWILLNYGLIGFFSALVGWKLTQKSFYTIVLSIFAILNPVILQRAAIHDTLTAHWLILYAIYAGITGKNGTGRFHWPVLVFLTMMIHVYFLPMIGFIVALNIVWTIFQKQKFREVLFQVILFVCSVIGMYYIAGYNYILPETSTYGELSMNLNAFFNPDGASIFLRNRETYPLQYEGFNYLGLGMILLVVLSLCLLRFSDLKALLVLGIPCGFYLILAVSHVITFDRMVLLEIPFPEKLLQMLSIFRSSGRLAWPFYYIFLYFAGWLICRAEKLNSFLFSKKWMLPGILSVLLLIQIGDLSGFFRQYYSRFHQIDIPEQAAAAHVLPEDFPASVKHIAVTDGESQIIDRFALFAIENGYTFNKSANARKIRPIFGSVSESVRDMIADGTLKKDTVYFLLNAEDRDLAEEKYPEWFTAAEPYPYLFLGD